MEINDGNSEEYRKDNRASIKAQEQRVDIINQLLNDTNECFEARNFDEHPSKLTDLSKSLVNSYMMKKDDNTGTEDKTKKQISSSSSDKFIVLKRFHDAQFEQSTHKASIENVAAADFVMD